MRGAILTCTFVLLAAGAWPAPAQVSQQQADSLRREIDRLKSRIDSLEQLVARLLEQGRETGPVEDELAKLRAAARQAAEEAAPAAEAPEQQSSRTRNLQILNPEISVTGDVVGNFVAPGNGRESFSATPREFEFSFQAALDPYTRTKIFITKEEDFEIAGLPEEEGEDEHAGGFEIEEGYMYWVGLPGEIGLKLGKFRQEIGLYNRWHTHALQEIERPLATTAFLGEDGLIQTGASMTLPSVMLGPATQTAIFEVTRGDNVPLFENGGDISYLGRLQSFWDLGASYFQLGATGVYGENDDQSLVSRLLGLDVSFRWTPGQARYRDFQAKGEWYLVEKDFGGAALTGSGGYLQANYRLDRRWIIGTRADYLDGFGDGPTLVQFVPTLTWWQSEFVRLRLQYNYLRPERGPGDHTLLLQAVWAVGPHKHEIY